MNSYEIITNSILEWAKQHENIRAVIMIGSRARTYEKADQWSDLDILVIVEDISEYIQTNSWINK
jgi:aminoglycoside 6-adenylyltransferase